MDPEVIDIGSSSEEEDNMLVEYEIKSSQETSVSPEVSLKMEPSTFHLSNLVGRTKTDIIKEKLFSNPEVIEKLRRILITENKEYQDLTRDCHEFIRGVKPIEDSVQELVNDVKEITEKIKRLGNPLDVVTEVDGRAKWDAEIGCLKPLDEDYHRIVSIAEIKAKPDVKTQPRPAKKRLDDSEESSSSMSDDDIEDDDVISCKYVTTTSDVPAIGSIVDWKLKIGDAVLVPEKPNDFSSLWLSGRVKAIQADKRGPHHYSVEVKDDIKTYSVPQVVAFKPQPFRFQVKQRVVGLQTQDPFDGKFFEKKIGFKAGFIAELPTSKSGHRYLIFFDDESVGYVAHKNCFANTKSKLENVVVDMLHCNHDEVDPEYPEYLERYFGEFPARALLRLVIDKRIRVKAKNSSSKKPWVKARVRTVYASIAQIKLRDTKELVWMSRGCFRFKEAYEHYFPLKLKMMKKAKRIQASSSKTPQETAKKLSHAVRKLSIAPAKSSRNHLRRRAWSSGQERTKHVLQFGTQEDAKSDTSSEADSLTEVQEKSTLKRKPRTQVFRSKAKSDTYPDREIYLRQPDLHSFPKIYNVHENSIHPHPFLEKAFKPHLECSKECLNLRDENHDYDVLHEKTLFRYQNPYSIPLVYFWKRLQISTTLSAKHRDKKAPPGNKCIIYKTPCGRSLRDIEEVAVFLKTTESRIPLDYFTFDPELELYTKHNEIGCYYLDHDLSKGVENKPISVINDIDDSEPTPFNYVNYTTFSSKLNFDHLPIRPGFRGKEDEHPEHAFDGSFNVCCSCTDNCINPEKCTCQRLNQEEQRIIYPEYPELSFGYSHKKLEDRVYTGIYECYDKCPCNKNCPNRLVQLGIRNRLQLFKTAQTGWGIRPLHDIPRGSFLCQYIAKMLTPEQGNDGQKDDTYFAELDLIDDMEGSKQVNNDKSYPVDFIEEMTPVSSAGHPYISLRKLLETPYSYVVDAFSEGNIGRFFNHSCDANVIVQNVFIDTHDPRFYAIALFAKRTIKAFEELRWDYGYLEGSIEGRTLYCKCGSKNCRGRLL